MGLFKIQNKVIVITGGGDSFMGGLIYGLLKIS